MKAHKPGEAHRYRIECEVCGQRGQIKISVEPQYPEPRDEQAQLVADIRAQLPILAIGYPDLAVQISHAMDMVEGDDDALVEVGGDVTVTVQTVAPETITTEVGGGDDGPA